MSEGHILVIGGGIAGMSVSRALSLLGYDVTIVEKAPQLGGKICSLHHPFPGPSSAMDILAPLVDQVREDTHIRVNLSLTIHSWSYIGSEGLAELSDGSAVKADAMVLATGLEEVPPSLIPEYRHGSKVGVITSSELEERLAKDQHLIEGDMRSVVFIQCVGSRTERRGVSHCSAYCCTSSVKNALLLKMEDPEMEVTVLYIDIRTAGPEQEAIYREARRRGIRFIRGQPSLVMEREGKLLVCGENTLLRELYEIPADLVVLATGLRPCSSNTSMLDGLQVVVGATGFPDHHTSVRNGVFLAGSVKRPMGIEEATRDAKATALDVHEHLMKRQEQ